MGTDFNVSRLRMPNGSGTVHLMPAATAISEKKSPSDPNGAALAPLSTYETLCLAAPERLSQPA
jgi:hypothetical protein